MYIQLSRNDGHNDVEYEITYNNALHKPLYNMTYDYRWHSQYHLIHYPNGKVMIKRIDIPYYINSSYIEY